MTGLTSALAGLGMGASAASGVLGAESAQQTAAATASMYSYQASLASLNKQIYTTDASYAFQQGDQQSLQEGLALKQQFGKVQVAQASSGFDINSGSNKQVQDSEATLANLDYKTIRMNAARTAAGFTSEAAGAEMQSDMYTKAASNTKAAGSIAATASFIGAASSVSSEWLRASQMGIFGKQS